MSDRENGPGRTERGIGAEMQGRLRRLRMHNRGTRNHTGNAGGYGKLELGPEMAAFVAVAIDGGFAGIGLTGVGGAAGFVHGCFRTFAFQQV